MVCSYTNRMDVHETAFNIKSIFFMFLCEDLLWSVLNSYILPDFLVLELQAASSWKATPYLPGTVGSLHVCTVLKKPISASRWTLWLCDPETWFEFWHALSIIAQESTIVGPGRFFEGSSPASCWGKEGEGFEGSAGFDSGAFTTPKHRDLVASLQILINRDLSWHFVGEKFVDCCEQVSVINYKHTIYWFISVYSD